MKHVWSILCERSSIDAKTNLLSIFNCLEQLDLVIDKTKAPKGDIVLPTQFQLISLWTIKNPKKEKILEFQIVTLDPKGKILNKFDNKFTIKEGVLRQRNITNIQGLKITDSGRYVFRMTEKVNGEKEFKTVAELPLDINIVYKLLDRFPEENG